MGASDLLSQDEIDALLNGVGSGDVETETDSERHVDENGNAIIVYDFMSQDRIVRGRLPTLEMINERFGREFQINLVNMLRCECHFTVGAVSIQKYAAYLNDLIVPTSLNLVRVNPLRGLGLFVIDPNLAFAIVDHYFGGNGRMHSKVEGRDFTPTELSVIDRVLKQIFSDFEDAWKPTVELKFEHIRSELNPQFANIVTPSELVVISRFKVNFGESGGEIHAVMPYSMIDPIRDLLDSGMQSDLEDPDHRWHKSLRRDIELAELEICSTLTDVDLTVSELVALKAGDVIPFDFPEVLTLDAEGIPVVRGVFGEAEGQAAIKVTEWIKPEQSTDLVVRK